MAHYFLEGHMAGSAQIPIDRTLIADTDQGAIEDAKGHDVQLGEGSSNWARLTRLSDGKVIWEIGDPSFL